MLYILTPMPLRGKLHDLLRTFIRAALKQAKDFMMVNTLPDTRPGDVVVYIPPVSVKIGRRKKYHMSNEEIKLMSDRKSWLALKPPANTQDIRGTFWVSPSKQCMCLCVLHPAAGLYVERTLTARWLRIAHDMSHLTNLEAQCMVRHQWKFEINPPLSRLWAAADLVAFDIETGWPIHDRITHFAIGDKFGSASWEWTPEVRAEVAKWMVSATPKVAQNWVFDVPRLEADLGVRMAGPIHDTMAMRAEFCRQWPYGLQHIAAQFLVIDPWKTYFKVGVSLIGEYNAKDAESTFLAAVELFRLMPELLGMGLESSKE